jgi:hypothetical protein
MSYKGLKPMNKTIVPPIRQQMDMKTREVRLWFDKDASVAPDGRYRMLGGMFLPSNVKNDEGHSRIRGYSLIAGRNVDTKITYIFDEAEWVTVDHILEQSDGSIIAEGVVTWLLKVWGQYFANTYAHRQDDETLFRYQIDFNRCAMLQPKTAFLDAEWNDDSQPVSVINRELMLKRLKMPRDGILIKELDQFLSTPDVEPSNMPAVHALMCCLSTLDRYWA